MVKAKQTPLLECVLNVSEGRNQSTLQALADQVTSVVGTRLLDVDSGISTNRSVFTFTGSPGVVSEAAYRVIAEAVARIDMRRHQGVHPRIGAVDVCPFIPLRGLEPAEIIDYTRKLAARVGKDLQLPVYLYAAAATHPKRRQLATIRSGQYERLAAKMAQPDWRPDFGPYHFQPRRGALAMGVRPLMLAYNVNLREPSTDRAKRIAGHLRALRPRLIDDWVGPRFAGLRAIGWHMASFGCAQVSMNLTHIGAAPLHQVYREIELLAKHLGTSVHGSELVGLAPLAPLLLAGSAFLNHPRQPTEEELLTAAVAGLGLNSVKNFQPNHHILEKALGLTEPLRTPHFVG